MSLYGEYQKNKHTQLLFDWLMEREGEIVKIIVSHDTDPDGNKIHGVSLEDGDFRYYTLGIRDTVVYNETTKTYNSIHPPKGKGNCEMRISTRPGEGIDCLEYPEAARMLREHNEAWNLDQEKKRGR